MKNMLKDAFKLFMITLFAGLVLSIVYEITKEPIAVQEEKARQEAFAAVFEAGEQFESVELNAEKTEAALTEAGISGVTIEEVVQALGLCYCNNP